MKILVTGSAGFVGHHFVEHILAHTDCDVVGIDSFRHRGDSLRVHGEWPRYTMFCHDLTAPVSSRLISQLGHVDYIVNFASESHVDRSITDPVPFCQNNTMLMLNMLELARKMNVKKFVQISTDEVYGAAPEGHDHAEWEMMLPSNPYAASKAAQEAFAIAYWRTYGVPLIITNTMNMFGERQDTEKFIPMLISKIEQGQTVTIHGTPAYIGKRKYLHARNHADAVLFLLQMVPPVKYVDGNRIVIPSRYNIVGDIEMDNLQMAYTVSKILGKDLRYKLVDFHAARPGHDRRYSLDGTKIADAGWKAPMSFTHSLEKTIEWSLENKVWL